MSLGEAMMQPTAMLYRNLIAMEGEDTIRANPLDGVVLLSGCEKTTPAMLMAPASVGPARHPGHRRAETHRAVSGARCSDQAQAFWRFENDLRTGRMGRRATWKRQTSA